jgi:hypothetical protein
MWKTAPGSTGRLLQLCIGYFSFYVLTGIMVKLFVGSPEAPLYGQNITYLANNTLGGVLLALGIVLLLRWPGRLGSNRYMQWGNLRFPSELLYILPSGICTAIVIPTTTLMYTLPISVMVAMVIMRGSVIVTSRIIDAVQIKQGILKKKVFAEENWGVVFALFAVGTNVLWTPSIANALADILQGIGLGSLDWMRQEVRPGRGGFEFFQSVEAMTIMALYIGSYAIRLYIMNYYKNTRPKDKPLDNRGFFAWEQIFASITMLLLGIFFFMAPVSLGATESRIVEWHEALMNLQLPAILSGLPFGAVAFFSVFIFMFQGRTATFAGLVNRLTSLLAGTTATLVMAAFFGFSWPTTQQWVSLGFILVAVYFLTRAEKKRVAEGVGVQKAA